MMQLIYTVSGIIAIITGMYSFNNKPQHFSSAFFWIIFGSIVPSYIIDLGICYNGNIISIQTNSSNYNYRFF
ncbi:hypothetical protein SAMN02745150_01365 [Brevinema andersonii]|uniref:Uncharacterized protein n=1 Tax=Brevinema andersonii TaxID=34097 RepID=A0A1I1F626_BREAD|nr:hypothetical protein SAMN02745150_01365 [Brevinema andersonii]